MNEKHVHFTVDESLCGGCGTCAADCPMGIIDPKPYPHIPEEKEAECLECQHCLAVCPKGAISILGKDPKDSAPLKGPLPKPEEMDRLVKTRRAIRKYKKEGVDKALITHLLETTGYAPTGENGNSVHLTVVDDPEVMERVRRATYAAVLKAGEEGRVPAELQMVYSCAKMWEKDGKDIVFRGAPHLLVASAPKNSPTPEQDCIIALSYFELLAVSNGLGTVWEGIVYLILQYIAPELREVLGIPATDTLGYAMAFGKPAVRYARAVQSEGAHISRVN